jgi:hypothetical protein
LANFRIGDHPPGTTEVARREGPSATLSGVLSFEGKLDICIDNVTE